MPISSLRISNFRNITNATITPCVKGLNIFHGNNGSGKTSLLESIYYLGLGRSFRTSAHQKLIQQTTDKLSLFGQLITQGERQIAIGIEREMQGPPRLRIAEQDVASIAELANFLPLHIINSQSHQLFESGPALRRKYLDWGLFYESKSFLNIWRQYERALKQRNAVLRDKRPKAELKVWTTELTQYGLALDALRRDYLSAIVPIIQETTDALVQISNLNFHYTPGWDENSDLETILEDHYQEEYRLGFTQYGPHRADLDMTIDGIPMKHFLSRGQQKLLVCAMIIAQGKRLTTDAKKELIYLVDDLPSELDVYGREKLISLLSTQQTQVFITAIEAKEIFDYVGHRSGLVMDVFHVKQGQVEPSTNEMI